MSETLALTQKSDHSQIWKFGMFHRDTRRVTEYLPLHPIPQELEFVVRTVIGILQAEAVGV